MTALTAVKNEVVGMACSWHRIQIKGEGVIKAVLWEAP
jgi:hypothetical protein